MNFVVPIRDHKKISQIKNLLRGQARFRDLLLFVVGINTALRISDLLKLRIGHFLHSEGHLKNRFWIKEQKRGKRQEIAINESMRKAFSQYLATYPDIEKNEKHFLFFNTKAFDYTQPIGRGQAWRYITKICQDVGLQGNYGTHSLRKTRGYHARMQGVDLALIMLQHSPTKKDSSVIRISKA
jgi:integrase